MAQARIGRARVFCRDVLGMSSPDWSAGRPEIESGNVSLYLVDPTQMGSSSLPTPRRSRCACPTWRPPAGRWRNAV